MCCSESLERQAKRADGLVKGAGPPCSPTAGAGLTLLTGSVLQAEKFGIDTERDTLPVKVIKRNLLLCPKRERLRQIKFLSHSPSALAESQGYSCLWGMAQARLSGSWGLDSQLSPSQVFSIGIFKDI